VTTELILPAFAAADGLVLEDIAATHGETSIREGALAFVHRDPLGYPCGLEFLRGPRQHWFARGSRASLYAAPTDAIRPRLVHAQCPYEALCAAASEGHRSDTIYAAVPGRMLRVTETALCALIAAAGVRNVVIAFRADETGARASIDAENAIHAALIDSVMIEEMSPHGGSWVAALRELRGVGAGIAA
jgi:hypothetical protein